MNWISTDDIIEKKILIAVNMWRDGYVTGHRTGLVNKGIF